MTRLTTRPTIGLTSQDTARFIVDGVEYKIGILNEPEVDTDPTFLIFRGLEEEAILTFHLDPDCPCQDHPIAPPIEEDTP
jgi:hypothetical protein